jgi:hypothetical protein
MATIPQVILPRAISASGMPENVADGPPPTMGSRCRAVAEGLRYILGHPLLPGLYALDWGMTAVSYYRELFPLFVAELFISGRFGKSSCDTSKLTILPGIGFLTWIDVGLAGLNARGAMSALTLCNYFGGILGGLVTFFFAHKPHKGRQVM